MIRLLLILIVICRNVSQNNGEDTDKVHGFKHFCKKHPFSTKFSYSDSSTTRPSSCSITFPFKAKNKKQQRQICRYMGVEQQIEEPTATSEGVTCKYVSYSRCSPLPGNDRPTLMRDRCLVWSKGDETNELPSCPPGYSIPRSVDMKIIHNTPLVMDVPPMAYVKYDFSYGKNNDAFENDYCQSGWKTYKDGAKISCFKAFKFDTVNNAIQTKNFEEAKDLCVGHHGWLAMPKTQNKITFLAETTNILGSAGGFLGGYDANFDYRESDQVMNWVWLDGTPMSLGNVKKAFSVGCVRAIGSNMRTTSCDGKGLAGYVCERPGNIQIAPAAIQLFNDDYWGTIFGQVIHVTDAERVGMLCVRPADIEANSRKLQMGAFCDFLADMGHTVIHEYGICHMMMNSITTSQKPQDMDQICYDVQNTEDRQARYLNMNTYIRKLALTKLLTATKDKYKVKDKGRTQDAFIIMATVADDAVKKNTNCALKSKSGDWKAGVQDHYRFSSSIQWFDATPFEELRHTLFGWAGAGYKDTPHQVGERVTLEMWRRTTPSGQSQMYWPLNSCNDGKRGRTTVVASSDGLQDQPYYFRAPAGCSFGVRKYLLQTYCEQGWTKHVRETGETVCIKMFASGAKYNGGTLGIFNKQYGEFHRDRAVQGCKKENSVLASIKSYDEFKLIASKAHDLGNGYNNGKYGFWFWVGARHNKTGDDYYAYYWEEDGEPMGFNYLEHSWKTLSSSTFKGVNTGNCLAISSDYRAPSQALSKLMRWHPRACRNGHAYSAYYIAGYFCTKKGRYL